MAMLSPYLLTHPMDLALALGQKRANPVSDGEEQVEIVISSGADLKKSSGWMSRHKLRQFKMTTRVRVERRRRTKTYLNLRTQVRGSWFQASAPVQFRTSRVVNSYASVTVSGSSAQVSSALAKASRRVAGIVKPPRTRTLRSRLSKPLRPSPEIINVQSLDVTEVGTNGVLQPAQSGMTVVPRLFFRRDWTGQRTPGYGGVKKGQLPVNPHTVSLIDVLDDRFVNYQHNTSTGGHSLDLTRFSNRFGVPSPPVTHDTNMVNEAGNKALQRLIKQAGVGVQANFAQNLAQINQTVSLVASTAMRLAGALKQLKRLNFSGAIATLKSAPGSQSWGVPKRLVPQSGQKALASNWLALQYGWKPLLRDIQEAFQLLPTSFEQGSVVHRVTASASSVRDGSAAYPTAPSLMGSVPGKTFFLTRTTVKYGVSYRIDDPAHQYLAQLGFTNPINLAWEVLPFSFVVDWFVPIGQYLESLSAFHGLAFVDGFKTTFTRAIWDSAISYNAPGVGVPQTLISYGATYRQERIALTRVRLTAFPSATIPTLVMNPFRNSSLPGVVAGTNDRAVNAIALLFSVFGR